MRFVRLAHLFGVWIGGRFCTPAARRADLAIEVMGALCSAKHIGLVQFGPLRGACAWMDCRKRDGRDI